MKILCSSKKFQGGQVVNKVGNYLYNHIDGAFKFEKSPNMYDVYFIVLYQIPEENRTTGEDDEVHELPIDLNITTYEDKIRVNIIVQDEYEKTIGTKTFSYDKLDDLEKLRQTVLSFVEKKVTKEYQEYDFLF